MPARCGKSALAVLLFGASVAVFAQVTPQRTQKQAEAQKQLGDVRAQIKALS